MNITYLNCTDEETFIPDNKEKIKGDYPYNINDCILVRTTDGFPHRHMILTPSHAEVKESFLSKYIEQQINIRVTEKILSKNPNIEQYSDEFFDLLRKEISKYEIEFITPRDTIHFCINGLAQSHMYGNFDDREYIIVEPLKHHIDKSLKSLRPEDTFFKGDMHLSNDCAIIMSEDTFNEIVDDPKFQQELETFKIFVYIGKNQVLAVNKTLNQLGYDSFMISNNDFTFSENGNLAEEMNEFLQKILEENDISRNKHIYTEEFKEENRKLETLTNELDNEYLNYLLSNIVIPDDIRQTIIDYLNYKDTEEFQHAISNLIDIVGLETLEHLTHEFNNRNKSKKENKQR